MHECRLIAHAMGKLEAAQYLKERVEVGYAEDWKSFDKLLAISQLPPATFNETEEETH